MSAAIIAIIVVVIVIVVLVIAGMTRARRRRLQERFGPEYDRVVEEKHGHLKAEAELAGRQRRVQRLDIQPLSATARETYAGEWAAVQERFVDQPRQAVAEAQLLVVAVMRDRGYPTEDDDQIVADLSVEHAGTLGHYRAARQITANAEAGDASTEDLRQAMVNYRALFSELLGQADDASRRPSAVTVPAGAGTAAGSAETADTYETDNPDTFRAGDETATAGPEEGQYPAFDVPADESGDATASRARRS
jgi:FtsZ-interacting cell division protein ZipA